MTKGTGSLGAVWTLACVSVWGLLSCNPKLAPTPDLNGRFPVAEHRVFVELPGNTALSADQLRAQYRTGRRTISHVRQRCVGNPPPAPALCTETTDVRISAVEGARYIDTAKAPERPQLIAWIENLGNRPTYDGIEPSTSAVYALVVNSSPNTNPAVIRVRFPATRAPGERTALTTPAGRVYPCHTYGQPYISDADFQPCSPYPPIGMGALHSLSVSAIFASASTAMLLSPSDPTWFSCSSGCCSSTAYQALTDHGSHGDFLYSSSGHLLALGPSASH
jgi:hypothetical protein